MKEFDFKEINKEVLVDYLQKNIRPTFNINEFDWEFLSRNSILRVMVDNSNIVASQAMLPIHLNIRSKVVLTAKSETSFLCNEYRGKNYFENLYTSVIHESKDKGIKLIWGFTPATKVWKNKLNFDVVKPNISNAEIRFSKYPSNKQIDLFGKNIQKKIIKKLFYTLLRVFEKKVFFNKIGNSLKIEHTFPELNILRSFQEQMVSNFNIDVYLDFNKEYINWRIVNNPVLKYNTLFFYNGDLLQGYVIYSVKNDILSLSDFSFLTKEVGVMILTHIINEKHTRITSIYYFGNDDSALGGLIFDIFKDFKATITKSDWANTVIKDISNENLFLGKINTSKWFINGLWTEGYSI